MLKNLSKVDTLLIGIQLSILGYFVYLNSIEVIGIWTILILNNYLLMSLLRHGKYLEVDTLYPTEKGVKFLNETIFYSVDRVFKRLKLRKVVG